jgi:hypothetical protein
MDITTKVQLAYKVALIFAAIGGLLVPIILAIMGVVFVRKNQRKKEEAEVKLTEAQVKLTEKQTDKIQEESRNVILDTIKEPTIKEISEGYSTLMANFKIQIEQLQSENKRIRYDFNLELDCLREQIEELRTENKKLREDLSKSEKDNDMLKKKINSFIEKTDKKNNQGSL